ncbi:uncharacterized protein LOC143212418 [Lasioglossum baleicum]|uniref:uncharacterized protein LOC143212418 n=1 Tax=Lasioglossum baleicum TaxID=434251 RepID=UPI003FCC6F87
MAKIKSKGNEKDSNQNNKESKVKCTKRSTYGSENLRNAINEVRQGNSIAAASRIYNVPQSTIRARVQGKYCDKKPGPNTVLSEQEEDSLVKWIFHCGDQGFPVTKEHLLQSVQLLLAELKRQNPFPNGVPGRHWYEGFLRRHTDISRRLSENVTLSRARVSDIGISEWFKEIRQYLESKDLLNIDSSRIFNCDETVLALNPEVSAIPVKKGTKNVYNIVGNNEMENVTVLVTANATGQLASPFMLFSGQKLAPQVEQLLPVGFSAGVSDNGWMTAKNFYEYVVNILYPWLLNNNIVFPIILYINGHSSHITLSLSNFCQKNRIELVALKANTTHIVKPLDVEFFHAFKSSWQKNCMEFCRSNNLINLKQYQVASVLQSTFESIEVREIIQNGFRTCGLYPIDENIVNYDNVFSRIANVSYQADNIPVSHTHDELSGLKCIESMIGKDKLLIFKSYECRQWCGKKEDENLFYLWFDLSHIVQQRKEHIEQNVNNFNIEGHFVNCKYEDTEIQTLKTDPLEEAPHN